MFFPLLHYILLVSELPWDHLSHNSPYWSILGMLISPLPWECSVQAPRLSRDNPLIQQWKCLGIGSLTVFLLNPLSQPAFPIFSSLKKKKKSRLYPVVSSDTPHPLITLALSWRLCYSQPHCLTDTNMRECITFIQIEALLVDLDIIIPL